MRLKAREENALTWARRGLACILRRLSRHAEGSDQDRIADALEM